MINSEDFRKQAHRFVDWIADYYNKIETYPVKSRVKAGDIYNQLPENPPEESESIDAIFKDFCDIIMPGITHWQSPNFFAYFPSNSSYPSVLAEMLTAALGAQCMIWETSPAATELEELTMNWLKQMTGLPSLFEGVIQDTASTSTLCSILCAREKYSDYCINDDGFENNKFRVYCSSEAHSSVEKAVKIAGIGKHNLVEIPVDETFKMSIRHLEQAIINDKANEFTPICVIATIGTTGLTAIDPITEINELRKKFNLWIHIDAAYGGTALVLPEFRHHISGIEAVDSIVINPHKWMFTNFDCSAYFVRDKQALIKTFEILPEYLKTQTYGEVNDYRDWGIALGRRFRALKLWFVIRDFGVEGIRKKIRLHIELAKYLEKEIDATAGFELMAPVTLGVVCFRYNPKNSTDIQDINKLNELLKETLNKTGKLFLTHTKINGKYVLRIAIGQTYLEKRHVEKTWEQIKNIASKISQ